jgi:hypothetical protein
VLLDRFDGPRVSPKGTWKAEVRATGKGKTAKETIWLTARHSGRAHTVFSETEYYTSIGPGETPGPIVLVGWSGDDRWLFFSIDPGGSGSIADDGLTLRVVSVHGGRVTHRPHAPVPRLPRLVWRPPRPHGRDRQDRDS